MKSDNHVWLAERNGWQWLVLPTGLIRIEVMKDYQAERIVKDSLGLGWTIRPAKLVIEEGEL